MESVKKSIDERAKHKREYDIRVNERHIQTTKGKVDTGKAVDASLVNTECIGTESKDQGMMHMLIMKISDLYMMKSQWLRYIFKSYKGRTPSSELGIHDHNNEQSSSKLVQKVVPQADKIATSIDKKVVKLPISFTIT
ncbi:hypothetical protein Tco_0499701 [Tanacetum coccineum]